MKDCETQTGNQLPQGYAATLRNFTTLLCCLNWYNSMESGHVCLWVQDTTCLDYMTQDSMYDQQNTYEQAILTSTRIQVKIL